MLREIIKYKGVIKTKEEKEKIDLELYKPDITPKKYYTMYGPSDLLKE